MLETEGSVPSLQDATPVSTPAARRVAINALSPFMAQVITRLLMLGYLIVQFRLVGGPDGRLGDYFLAGILLMYTSTVSEWGLGTLLTREAAKGVQRAEEQVAALFRETLSLRLLISLVLFVPVAVFVAIYRTSFNLSAEGAWAVGILTVSLLPSAFSGSITAVLYAYERMALPAAIGVVTAIVNVLLGVGALLLGWGIIGLAGAAFISTLFTAAIFLYILRRDFPTLLRATYLRTVRTDKVTPLILLRAGWPLMLNALLVGLFFRADQFIIKPVVGGLGVEQYQAAYSFLNFVLLITPAATMALFPRMARHAVADRPRLAQEYIFALKVLLVISVPIVALTVWYAPLLNSVVTGFKEGYLPQAAVALQILIFFLPFSFINGVTQYVLIALDLQRLITRAFALTLAFNLGANLLLVPFMGINGAALATVLSELVLLGPFLWWTGREIGSVPLGALAVKPLFGGAAVAAATWLLWSIAQQWQQGWANLALYAGAGLFLLGMYVVALLLVRPFSEVEGDLLKRALRRS